MGHINKCAAIAASALCLMATASFSQTVLNYAEGGPNRGTRAESMNWFANELERRSNGELQMQFHWSGSLLGPKQVLSGLQDGVTDMGTVIGAYSPTETVFTQFAELPIIEPDSWVGGMAVLETMNTSPALQKAADDLGLVFLSNFFSLPVWLACNGDPVKSLADVEGKKIRGAQFFGEVLQDYGASIVNQSIYKAYQAMDTGLVDCTQSYAFVSHALKHYEVADSLTQMRWGHAGSVFLYMTKDAFSSLTPEQQQLVKTLGNELTNYASLKVLEADKSAIEQVSDGVDGHKMTIYRLPEEDRQTLLAEGEKARVAWVEKATAAGYPAQEILDTYLAAFEKYAKIRDEQGYPTLN